MKKLLSLAAVLLALLLCCTGCNDQPENKFYDLDHRVSTEFFRCQVEEVTTHENYHGLRANEGCRIVVVELTVENTEHYPLPMGRYDFRLQWGMEEDDCAYPEVHFYEAQFPDAYDIPDSGDQQGQLVFQVPLEKTELALAYLEIFENGDQGDAHFIYFNLDDL